ncbi:MAG TPA: DPP IV N-terminal domain-containing protein, partial [Xanthomonadaceae bacterium]|nr:DPP IV N-terminal domain-containing protein [Xanthomonadaceae bacterium]
MRAVVCTFLFALSCTAAAVPDPADTRLLGSPANGGDRIAFVYDNDLWLTSREGGSARRITQAAGMEREPVFSPDGRWLAFSANYDDNVDVYVMPAEGGPARRLTWHPGADVVRGFTPDSAAVLFQSGRSVHTNRHTQLFTVPVEGGVPTRLPIPNGSKAAISPDGSRIAYTPLGDRFAQWKNYRGGTQSRIWIMRFDDQSVQEVPKPAGGSNDTDPLWMGEALVFNSDRDGEFNLYRFDPASNRVEALTRFDDFPVRSPSVHADGSLVFEHGGWLYRLDAG